MVSRSKSRRKAEVDELRSYIEKLIRNFESELRDGDLRGKVLAIIPIFRRLRELGKSLIPSEYASAARDRILFYFQRYAKTIIKGDELLVVSGIQEYARRVRELRVQFGWPIASGVTLKEMYESGEEDLQEAYRMIKPDEYVLLEGLQDRDSAHRWATANAIRKEKLSVRDKILKYLIANIGRRVTNEELRYVAGNKTEWARRVRELRTELGWPVVARMSGMPDLPVGVYVLQSDRQSPIHDRKIPDEIRREVLRRDDYKCSQCGWSYEEWNQADPRHLEIHHIKHLAKGGSNEVKNLMTICRVCHDNLHRTQ